jgi:glycosyltransferase involved in cell wall biosynthesis
MVHPSLAEGGDIFNFSRAVSAGVPALMSDIPVVTEMFSRRGIDRSQYHSWLFKPTDTIGLADLMDHAISNPEIYTTKQAKILEDLSSYGFPQMAARYYQLYMEL